MPSKNNVDLQQASQRYAMTQLITLLLLLLAGLLETVRGPPPVNQQLEHYIEFQPFSMPIPARLEGPLSRNARLDLAELVWDGDFVGAESIAYRGNEAYTGVIGGYIVRINGNGTWEKVVQTGKPCAGPWEMNICGRPLGLRFDPGGKLLVADSTKGLLRIDVDTRKIETLIPRYGNIEGGNEDTLNIADDLDVSRDGSIYFSDIGVNTKYLADWVIDFIADPTGRLIKYNPETQETEVLLRRLRFANGVQLSASEDFVAVNELGMGRTWKYYLTGNRTGESELLVENLPGLPDNIRPNGKGGFYISLVYPRYETLDLFGKVAPLSWARKLLVEIQRGLVNFFHFLYYSVLPNQVFGNLLYYAMLFGPFGDHNSYPRHTIIVEIDESGKILGSLHNLRKDIAYRSQLDPAIGQEYSYLGSPFSPQLWRIRTEHLF